MTVGPVSPCQRAPAAMRQRSLPGTIRRVSRQQWRTCAPGMASLSHFFFSFLFFPLSGMALWVIVVVVVFVVVVVLATCLRQLLTWPLLAW